MTYNFHFLIFQRFMISFLLMRSFAWTIMTYNGELQVGKRSPGSQKRYKDTLKASRKDFNIPTESWEQIAQDRTKWRGLIRRELVNTKQKESAKPSRNVHSGKPELRHHQQSFLPQTSIVLSATGSLELRLVSSAILEHTNNNTSHSWLGLVIVSNDRRTIVAQLCN